jgi:predicted amidophosphoribosyltransferase
VLHPVLAALEHLLLPNACIACDRLIQSGDPDALVCTHCRWRLKPLVGGCRKCHQPLPSIGGCRFCSDWPAHLAWVRSGFWLGPEAREIVHHLKYEGYLPLAAFMADMTARSVPPAPAAVLVPVPLSPSRLKQRGYNQAALLAHALGVKWGVPVCEHLLTRVRDSTSQTALTPSERLANVTGAFVAPSRVTRGAGPDELRRAARAARELDPREPRCFTPSAPSVRVVIVDDVLTTGATLCAAAAALGSAGWHQLAAVTFARAEPFEQRVA